jgi:hypothetical protein
MAAGVVVNEAETVADPCYLFRVGIGSLQALAGSSQPFASASWHTRPRSKDDIEQPQLECPVWT